RGRASSRRTATGRSAAAAAPSRPSSASNATDAGPGDRGDRERPAWCPRALWRSPSVAPTNDGRDVLAGERLTGPARRRDLPHRVPALAEERERLVDGRKEAVPRRVGVPSRRVQRVVGGDAEVLAPHLPADLRAAEEPQAELARPHGRVGLAAE